MHGGVVKTQSRGETQTNEQSHANTGDTNNSQIALDLNTVQLAQHKDGVDEHEHVAASHLYGVKEDGVRADVTVATRRVRVHGDAVQGGVEDYVDKGLFPVEGDLISRLQLQAAALVLHQRCVVRDLNLE